MQFFDFHHHDSTKTDGIFNLSKNNIVPSGFFSAGIHPWNINDDWELEFEKIKGLSQLPNCVAIGECGLDGLIKTPDELQRKIFLKHTEWAQNIGKSLIIHCVRHFPEIIHLTQKTSVPKVVHGFNKNKNIAHSLLENGFHLSFGKAALHSVSLQNILREVPEDRFFLETDAEDFNLENLYQKTAEIRQTSPEKIQEIIYYNFEKIRNGN